MQTPSVLPGGNHKRVTHWDWWVPCAPAPWGPRSRPVHTAAPFHVALLL